MWDNLIETIKAAFIVLLHFVESFGYLGIFIMTVIESTFIPIPSELTLIPAGVLAHKGEMNLFIVIIVSVFGTLVGSLINYAVAYHLGRKFLVKYGKYFFFNEQKIRKMESFFKKHGPISMFSGRLLPGLKHFISFPAGLAKMPLTSFISYTTMGALVWVIAIVMIGYGVGADSDMVDEYIQIITLVFIAIVLLCATFYKMKNKKSDSKS